MVDNYNYYLAKGRPSIHPPAKDSLKEKIRSARNQIDGQDHEFMVPRSIMVRAPKCLSVVWLAKFVVLQLFSTTDQSIREIVFGASVSNN